jgi:acyl-coenzyme A synthetase/AMP-(fatty) acid ligase
MNPAVVDGQWQVPEWFNFGRDVVEALALENPDRRALTFVDSIGVIQRLTFHDVALGAARWSRLLSEQGVAQGDRVLVVVGKTPDWHQVLLGTLRLGAIAVPCPEQLRAKDLAFRARHSVVGLVVAERSAEVELAAMARLLHDPPPVLYVDEAAPLIPLRQPLGCTNTHADEAAFILYTSGTAKEPRGVIHTHGYTFAQRMQAEHWLDAQAGDLVWCTAGTGWAKSIWNVFLGPWSCGAEIVLHRGGFDPYERFDLISKLGVDVLCQAPTEYRLMAKLDDIEQFDLRLLRHAVSAGEPLNPEVIQRFRDAFGIMIHDGYGQTENTLLVANAPTAEIRPGSMGLPTPGHDVAVIDEHGMPTEPGVEGDIALRGSAPCLFAGYLGEPEATQAAFRGEWYVTGDRATRDPDGYFWFAGRADDVILSAAYRIGPFEVESALLEHPAVVESAVVGKPDADRGQIVKAFVVLRPGVVGDAELVVALQDHCKQITAPYKYPREIEFVKSLPKTRSGKIRRIELRQLEEERAAAAPSPEPTSPRRPEPEPEPKPELERGEGVEAVPAVVVELPPEPAPEPAAPELVREQPEPQPVSPSPLELERWPEPFSIRPEGPVPQPPARPTTDVKAGSALTLRLSGYGLQPGEDVPSDPRSSFRSNRFALPGRRDEPDDHEPRHDDRVDHGGGDKLRE